MNNRISWNEIKSRAITFSREYQSTEKENAEAQTFWNDFFYIFGIDRKRVASFEHHVKKLNSKTGRIDLFWKGMLIVEHKSKGENLDKALDQAMGYFEGLKDYELPKFILISDFQQFRLYDVLERKMHGFALSEFYQQISLFGFMIGAVKKETRPDDPLNIEAAELMATIHDQLFESGYKGEILELFLVRILFMFFADDTAIFQKNQLLEYIEQRTKEDGTDLGMHLAQLFQILNTSEAQRQTFLDEDLAAFPYINGDLFKDIIPIPQFNSALRYDFLKACYFDWSKISPAIFGSMFQSVMDTQKRRHLGAHYTSESNIMKVIEGLFLDELKAEFETSKKNKRKLIELYGKLGTLSFLDPSCGSGNFLIIAYREIRLLEIEVLKILYANTTQLDISTLSKINVDKFYGFEIEEFSARIAEVALWLIDHQMNLLLSQTFGQYYARIPLNTSAKIYHGNALQLKWEDWVKPQDLSYILGNPPFIGKQLRNTQQKADMDLTFAGIKNYGVLDYVACWYLKAAQYIQHNPRIRVAFVSTNSIAQGEQVGILWQSLFHTYKIKIHFAHRSFKWSNEAKGNAQVFVVIIGFGVGDIPKKKLFDYETPKSEALERVVNNINAYLVNAPDILVKSQQRHVGNMPAISFGSMPNDGGHLLFTDDEKNEFLQKEPQATKFIRPLVSAREFINGISRWCLWLSQANPKELQQMPEVMKRVAQVKQHRQASSRKSTQKLANIPALFGEIREQKGNYIVIPRVTSENRNYVPMGFLTNGHVISDSCLFINDANLFHFGVVSSAIHIAWLKFIGGRLEGRFRYSGNIVYNNFPFPKNPDKKQVEKVQQAAEKVLEVRKKYPESSLADLYDPLTMPADLVKAHQALDKAVDLCYRNTAFANEVERIEFLFELYNSYVYGLF